MPGTRKRKKIISSQAIGELGVSTTPTPSAPSSSLAATILPPTQTDYRTFLNSLAKKQPEKLGLGAIKKWQDVDLSTPEGLIVNDIARKFNTNAPLGIEKVKYTRGPGQPNYYEGATPQGAGFGPPRMTLAPPPYGGVAKGPSPVTVGHELVHANDHQIDQLNPLVWKNLGTLAQTGTAEGPMPNFADFESSVGRIQHKVAPGGSFKPDPAYPNSGYAFNQAYIEHEMQGAGRKGYSTPLVGAAGSAPNWLQLFGDINAQLTSPAPSGGVPNQGFYLNRASEFPAFMSERLTVPWSANTAPNPLSLPEARFIHSTLGNMETAYPAADYPTMNNYIGQRRNSLEHAYYPGTPANGAALAIPAGPPEGVFSRGGRVTGKNLLSRFKKI